jgi:hypothetical protein
MNGFWEGAEVIHVYSRADALADGVLVDVSELAREAGFKFPVALTSAVYNDCVAWDNAKEKAYQDESGRLWDIFTMALYTIRNGANTDAISFSVLRIPRGCKRPQKVDLRMVIGPGDTPEPVITVMFPHED